MTESSDLRMKRMPLNHGGGHIPALGFGTLIPDPAVTITATRGALEAGFRHFDCAERYRNEREVGEALQAGLAAEGIAREDIFVTTKLWNSNHRPERVEPAFEASLDRLRLNYLDLYLIHTPFAFQPGDEQDPRDQNGNVVYDYPQSDERIFRRSNFQALRSHHPGKPSGFEVKLGKGDLWITEYTVTYQGRPVHTVSIMEFRNDKGRARNTVFRGSLRGPEVAESMGSGDRLTRKSAKVSTMFGRMQRIC